MKKLLAGVEKFQKEIYSNKKVFFQQLAKEGQHPRILFITCSDSRLDPFLLTQSEPGELFVIRNAGNMVPAYTGNACGEAASIEYALQVLGVKHVVVCGHTQCGALEHLLEHRHVHFDNHLPMVSKWLRHADATRAIVETHWDEFNDYDRWLYAIETNVAVQIKHLQTHPAIAQALSNHQVQISGWVYQMDQGNLKLYNEQTGTFVTYDPQDEKLIHLKSRQKKKRK